MGLRLSRATHLIEQAGKRNNTLTIIVILVENNIIISAPTLFQTPTNVQKGLMIVVERPSVVTPKEATTVHGRQASLMVKPAQVILIHVYYCRCLFVLYLFSQYLTSLSLIACNS